jgi:hypothetical protein
MKIAGVIWLRDIVDKLLWKHNVTTFEVEEVLNNSPRYRFIVSARKMTDKEKKSHGKR